MTDGQHPHDRTVAGRYQVREELGRGGMGVVWRAWDPELEREVAIKEVLLPPDLPESEREEMHARTRREARSAARLSHPSVVAIHDVLDFEGHPWIVMELLNGRSLARVLKTNGPLPAQHVAGIAASLLSALVLAHSKGVVHRDIKPGNVMLCDDGRVVLTDFGIATIDGDTAITRTGSLIGSPEYMAPERLQNERSDTSSDMWSLGTTLYAACEGQSPFRRETVTAAISAVMSAPVPSPQRAGFLTPLLLGMLERDPQRRLDAVRAQQMMAATVPTAPYPTGQGGAATPPAGSAPPMAARAAEYAGAAAQAGSAGAAGAAAPPSGAEAAMQSPPPPSDRAPGAVRQRRSRGGIYAAVAGGLVVVVVLAVAAVWFVNRPLETRYRLYVDDRTSVTYPHDWEVTPTDYDESGTISHPDSRETISISFNRYDPEDVSSAQEALQNREAQTWEQELQDYQRVRDEPYGEDFLPAHWSGHVWEFTYTDAAQHEDHPERTRIRVEILVGEEDEESPDYEAHWLIWDLPTDKRSDYRRIIDEVNHSFRPNL
ncbi:serine/threonine-protein kinase [Salinactinospora qingdaonensis]|uniref:non-specific serine/threonine protein kinase n=1 Tax=Salinactinospora qingdaonensis TaxID=702744 RepID=A0ABP7FR05_9ACTN